MNTELPPLGIPQPQIADRRKERSRPIPIPSERLQRRQEIARRLVDQIRPLSQALHRMSDAERRAVFYKLEHEIPVSLVGTDLKPLGERSEHFTLAVPKSDNLDKIVGKIDAFATGEIRKGHVPNEQIATQITSISRGNPKDRLSQALFDEYDQLVQRDSVICEIEMLSLAQGVRQQRLELQECRQ